jgi:FtsZ-binding cell division protein ZapB
MSADITVMGLVEGIHILEDIQIGVPKGVVVTIPADLAYRSRDLWRALSQRVIFQVAGSPSPNRPVVPYQQEIDELKKKNLALQGQIEVLRGEVQTLRVDNESLRNENTGHREQRGKLDEILSLVKGGLIGTLVATNSGQSTKAVSSVIDAGVPLFIPDSIRPKDVQTDNMTVEKDSSAASSVTDASSKLKSFKRKSQ